MIEIANKYITRPGTLGEYFTGDDGAGCCTQNEYYIHDTIIDFSGLDIDEQDEAAAVTLGASACFERCLIRGAGKLFLCGAGNAETRHLEVDKTVSIRESVLEHFGRRGPEVQCGMFCDMERVVVKFWSDPDRFTVRGFGAWAHDGGRISARDCIFWPYSEPTDIPFWQRVKDTANWIGESVNNDGLKALLDRKTYIPGRRRALVATSGGIVSARHCAFMNDSYTDSDVDPMSYPEISTLTRELNEMVYRLKLSLGVS